MEREEMIKKLMEYGLHENQAIEAVNSRNQREMETVLNFLYWYGKSINVK